MAVAVPGLVPGSVWLCMGLCSLCGSAPVPGSLWLVPVRVAGCGLGLWSSILSPVLWPCLVQSPTAETQELEVTDIVVISSSGCLILNYFSSIEPCRKGIKRLCCIVPCT